MGYGFWVLGFGFWVMGFGFWVLGFGLWVLDMPFDFTKGSKINDYFLSSGQINDSLQP
jgi:hypothetical protein